jgi:AAA ATPase domain
MKLHRLILTNYRGVTHREIEFPDQGVVVVCGANEVGKSSMIEALDLLLESKDRSTKKEVKQVKPTNVDVGSEVAAEISSGPYRFIYRKRFHKKCETELTMLAPRREQLTGDEAHDRVRAMLAETVDNELWHAQRVLQTGSTAAVNLSGCDALSRALDVAAAQSDTDAALSGSEPLLVERIDVEYARYFTPTGRPTGEWAAAISRLADADAVVAECAAAVAEVDERVSRHALLTEQVAELSQQRLATGPRLAAAEAAAEKIAELTGQAHEAKLVAAAEAANSAASKAAHAGRLRLLAEINSRTTTITAAQAEAQAAVEALASARADAESADAALEVATTALADIEARMQSARRALDELAALEEADRLSARLDKIGGIQRDCDRLGQELSDVAITDELLRRIENAAAAVDRTGGQLALISAEVQLTAAADLELVAGEQRVSVSAGQSWSIAATEPTEIEVPDVLTLRVTPGATALDIQAEHAAAKEDLTAALTTAHVADVHAARAADERRRELHSSRDRLTATMAGLCGDDTVDQLSCRLAQLRAEQSAEAATLDAPTARAELDAAETARAAADADCEAKRRTAAAAGCRLAETSTRATVLQEFVATQRAELDAATDLLAQERASVSDVDLASAADAALAAAQAAERRVAELTEELAAAEPDAVAAELADAAAAAEALHKNYEAASRALREVSIELSVFGGEGRQGKLDAAQTEREHAISHHARVGGRARAAQLLRSVMARHRDTTRLRYVEPYRDELQRLGRPVFGPTFEVDIDSDLCIRSRTLDGRTVPFESLSGGAKEQLGILARLAGSALVAKEDSVPVVIDDALGFSDPDRLAKMGKVFDTVGTYGQVIVLTCSPDRYLGVKGAHRIDLDV